MDPSAPLTVVQGVLAVCAVSGACYGFLKRQSPALMAMASTVNCGIAGLTFFGLREYIVSPVLVSTLSTQQYVRRRDQFAGLTPRAPITWGEIRSEKLIDTAIASGLAGGALNAWKRGRVGLVPGIVTASLICTLIQYASNELSLARIKLVSKQQAQQVQAPQVVPAPLLSRDPAPSSSQKIMDVLSHVAPIRRLSDEEYLQMMEKKKIEVDKRLHEVGDGLKEWEETNHRRS
ncbi:hypothetical protein BOTBODRAFT_419197 [Botryobasidium botryosum FD-172 SS1]|uniref:Uncharacterized protein n=1 Tax=Botryobasidium botryosum (strain FD-172 SS1) TaxID=930990 RepID=A0A067M9J8_BOTB1|nr:hypothetical protein BOTBODRAFT_419197 [Botryobasidium botryosum FD-172 SS1]